MTTLKLTGQCLNEPTPDQGDSAAHIFCCGDQRAGTAACTNAHLQIQSVMSVQEGSACTRPSVNLYPSMPRSQLSLYQQTHC